MRENKAVRKGHSKQVVAKEISFHERMLDETEMARQLDGIWIGAHQLQVNVARKKKKPQTGKWVIRWATTTTARRTELSYAKVVRKEKCITTPKQEKK
ncbi:hypothetical protein Ancab_021153 [Ancistrocladus abbreviatus]